MLDIEQIFNTLQCCYTCLVSQQVHNIEKLIIDSDLDERLVRAYSLIHLKLDGYITSKDYDKYNLAVIKVCGDCDCGNGETWIGIEPICEEDGATSTSTTSTTTTSTSTSTSTTTSTTSTTTRTSTTTNTTSTTQSTNTTSTTTSTSTTTGTSTSTSSSSSTSTVQTESSTPPDYLLKLALSSDASLHTNSLWLTFTKDTQIKVDDLNGASITLTNDLGVPFTTGQWQAGTSNYASPFNKVYRLNPVTNGTGGLLPGVTYKFSFRAVDNPSAIFIKYITIPTTSQGITEIPLSQCSGVITIGTITGETIGFSSSTTTTTTTTTSTSTTTAAPTTPEGVTYSRGKKITIQGGREYRSVDSENAKVIILPSGNIKIDAPLTKFAISPKQSTGNTAVCSLVLFDNFFKVIKPSITSALLSSTGYAVQPGDRQHIKLYWFNTELTDLTETSIQSQIWPLAANPGDPSNGVNAVWPQNSAPPEKVDFQVVNAL